MEKEPTSFRKGDSILKYRKRREQETVARLKKLDAKNMPGCVRPRGKSGRPTKINAEEKALIAKCSLEGMPVKDIAAGLGRGSGSVRQVLGAPDVREFIEIETRKLMEDGLVPSRETMVRLARSGKDSTDQSMLRLALDASKTILGAAGITSQGSTTINNILNVTNNPDTTKELSQLSEFLASKMRPQIECIDVGI